MKVYLAGRYSRKEELKGYADQIRAAGHEVTSRWLQGDHQVREASDAETDSVSVPVDGRPYALDDFEDLGLSDVVVSFTETPRKGGDSRGGRHVEFGLALAWDKRVLVVGPRENVFHTLPQVLHFWEWGQEVVEILSERWLWDGARYDYENQAWIVDGIYQDCGHPSAMGCDCFGRIHRGEWADLSNGSIH